MKFFGAVLPIQTTNKLRTDRHERGWEMTPLWLQIAGFPAMRQAIFNTEYELFEPDKWVVYDQYFAGWEYRYA